MPEEKIYPVSDSVAATAYIDQAEYDRMYRQSVDEFLPDSGPGRPTNLSAGSKNGTASWTGITAWATYDGLKAQHSTPATTVLIGT